jgi:CCR4-NOT transcription complex subunit 3
MADKRKLQTEIQQNLKKVDEGVELFDEIWEKVYSADNQTLKEKFEADLKKEIKKLQRLRDQIKTWISSNEIKDKNQLTEARKLIESKMEQFKICERDTKTKAYSKEGLARIAQVDPKEALREEKRSWLNECLERLHDLINTVEADKEKLTTGKAKASKNKDALEKLENKLQKQKWHIAKIELIIKLIDNEELDPSLIDGIKEGVEYYLETAPDDDGALGVEHEFDIYEDLELDSFAVSTTFEISPRGHSISQDGEDSGAPPATTTVASVPVVAAPVAAPEAKAVAPAAAAEKKSGPQPTAAQLLKGSKQAEKDTTLSAAKAESADSKQAAKQETSPRQQGAKGNPPPAAAASVPKVPVANVLKTVNDKAVPSTSAAQLAAASAGATAAKVQQSSPALSAALVSGHGGVSTPKQPQQAPVVALPPSAVASLPAPAAIPPMGPPAGLAPPTAVQQQAPSVPVASLSSSFAASVASNLPSAQSTNVNGLTSPASSIPLATPPMGALTAPIPSVNPLTPEMIANLQLLKQSAPYMPDEFQYIPRNPYAHAHPMFPTTPICNTNTDHALLIEKLPLDTMFFAFYFQQGSYQQVLAAKKLKKHSWRFHKKYATWFQRHSDPKIATQEFEEGTYVYFDYESGWSQRIKSEFKFEYAFLEDEI